jgi:rhodanese-related sulfurtransferase
MPLLLPTLLDRAPVPALSVPEVAARLRRADTRILDHRPIRHWRQGRIPGAFPLGQPDFDPTHLPPDKNTVLIFFAGRPSSSAALSAARRARRFGYTRVFILAAGLTDWAAAGWPVETSSAFCRR